jgi:hypothetical protein
MVSLEGAPSIVEGIFECSYNQLTSLEGAPQTVNGTFDCSYNNLNILKGAPRVIKGDFDCKNNLLVSLEGAPEIVDGNFDCKDNDNLQSLDYLPGNITPETLFSDFSIEEVHEFFRKNRPELLI